MALLRTSYFGVLLSVLSPATAYNSISQWDILTSYEFQNYTSQQCQAPYSTLNASGTYPIAPNNEDIEIGASSWTVAVSQPFNDDIGYTNYSLYFCTPSGWDFRPGNLEFSACALIFNGLSDNLIRRGQDDDGGCQQMLSTECLTAIKKQASTTGFYLTNTWTDNSPAPSNLTAGSLSRVCSTISEALVKPDAVPKACAQFVGPSMSWWDGKYSNVSIQVLDLTGPNSTTDKTCTFNTSTLPSSTPSYPVPSSNLSLVWEWNTLSGPKNSTALYDNATQNVLPLLVVTFPPANDSRTSWSNDAEGFMTCARANVSLPGSRVAPPLPAPTGLRNLPLKLSKGAIAGIAIAAVVAVAGIVGGLVWYWRRRTGVLRGRREQVEAEKKERELEKARSEEEVRKEAAQPMADSRIRYEIDGKGGRGELGEGLVSELEGSGLPELEGSRR